MTLYHTVQRAKYCMGGGSKQCTAWGHVELLTMVIARVYSTPCPEKNGPPKHVKITL